MDRATMALINSQTQLQSTVGVLVLKKAIDSSEISSQIMLDSLVPPSPNVGVNIDIQV